MVGASLAVAVLATLFPWTRFSTGSGFAGAWALEVRWSMLTACVAVTGLVLWLAFGRRPRVTRTVAIITGSIVAVGSLLAALNPPPFTKPALAPWISLAAGAVAAILGRVRELQVSRPTCLTRPWAGALIEQVTGRSDAPRLMCARKETGWRSREAST